MRGQTLTESVELVTEQCCTCGVVFAMTTAFRQQCLDKPGVGTGKEFYCPAGHRQWYTGKPKAQQEREARERIERILASREEDLRVERIAHAATKGQLTKTRKRVANGVCPCCHRTFQQLARHMKAKHPDHVTAVG